jgi:hypothetical protein
MSEYFEAFKIGLLFGIAVGALFVTYRCARWIYLTVKDAPPPPQADAKDVPETTERTGEAGNIVGFRQEWRQTG